MRSIYVVRHAQPDYPESGKRRRLCLGKTDLELSAFGLSQVEQLGKLLSFYPENVFSSPLKRAYNTATAFCHSPVVMDDLREIGAGEWEGLTLEEILAKYPKEFELRKKDPYNYVIPDGEPPAKCLERMLNAVRKILARTEGDVCIVSHSIAIRLLLNHVLNNDPGDFLKLDVPLASISIIKTDGHTFFTEPNDIGRQLPPK